VDVLADRPGARALRHDRPERVGLGGRVEQHLAPDGQTEPADSAGIDIGSAREEVERGFQVAITRPPESVRVALAATVEQEDPVAVAGQQPRVGLRPATAGERDHRRAGPRGYVPTPELEAVARPEADLLVRRAQLGRGHDGDGPHA
jgi:hypothetical protein